MASLQCFGIVVVMAGSSLRNQLSFLFVVRDVGGFLRAVAVRVRIVSVGIVVVRRAGIHCVENHAEEVALNTGKQIASASKRFLGSYAAATHEQHTVRQDRE